MLDIADISLWLNYLLDFEGKPVKNAEVEANFDIISFDFKPETTQINGFIKIINGDFFKNNIPIKNIYLAIKISPSFSLTTSIILSDVILPDKISSASGSSTYFWMVLLKGLAP